MHQGTTQHNVLHILCCPVAKCQLGCDFEERGGDVVGFRCIQNAGQPVFHSRLGNQLAVHLHALTIARNVRRHKQARAIALRLQGLGDLPRHRPLAIGACDVHGLECC